MKYIALVPTYQPIENQLFKVLEDLHKSNFEIVLVNDGSDKSFSNVFEKIPDYINLLSYEKNHGKGYALKYGLKFIKEKFKEDATIVTIDSDGQHKVSDALKICRISEKNPNSLILGSRKLDKSSPKKSRVGNSFARLTFVIATKTKINDTQTGLRAFNISLIDSLISIKGSRYEYEMNMLLYCARNNIDIIEENIETIYLEKNSSSHFNILKDAFKIVFEFVKFSGSSLIGFLVDYGLYSLFLLIPVEFANKLIVSNIIARIISATTNFTINNFVVFKNKNNVAIAALKYALLAIFILACNTLLLWLLVEKAHINEFAAKLIVEVSLFIVSWLVQRLLVFRRKRK